MKNLKNSRNNSTVKSGISNNTQRNDNFNIQQLNEFQGEPFRASTNLTDYKFS